jgi:high-affinity iron transporter
MIANLLIGLREGLEAALVVGILVAYLVHSGRRDRLPLVTAGVTAAVVLSLGFGAVLQFTSRSMTFEQQEVFGGGLSIVAVGFVTWMVFWMRRAARGLRGELAGRLARALSMGAGAIVLTAFLAVAREGLETALFLWAAVQATGSGWQPLAGAAIGLVLAVVLGWLIYRGLLRVNLGVFFRWTGAALIVVAAGVLAYGVHDLQEARVLPGLTTIAFDVSAQVPPSSWYGVLLKGTLNFSPVTTVLEAVVWVAYVAVMLTLFLRPQAVRRPAAPAVRSGADAALAG